MNLNFVNHTILFNSIMQDLSKGKHWVWILAFLTNAVSNTLYFTNAYVKGKGGGENSGVQYRILTVTAKTLVG